MEMRLICKFLWISEMRDVGEGRLFNGLRQSS